MCPPPLPEIPPIFLSSNFTASAHALRLISLPTQKRDLSLRHLHQLRLQLLAHLRSNAPPWPHLLYASNSQLASLRSTQRVTPLLAAVHRFTNSSSSTPLSLKIALQRVSHLSSCLRLAQLVRRLSQLLAQLPEHNPQLQPNLNFIRRVTCVVDAINLANSPSLINIAPLAPVRATLRLAHSNLSTKLSTAFATAIFTDVDTFDTLRPHHSAPPSSILSHLTPTQLALAIRDLNSSQSPADILTQHALPALTALFRNALHVDWPPPPPPPLSITSSSFTPVVSDEPSIPYAHPFALLPHQQIERHACTNLFRRVLDRMQSVLHRLSTLAENLKQQIPQISHATIHVFRIMQSLLSIFLQTLLNLSFTTHTTFTPHYSSVHTPSQPHISLLPHLLSPRSETNLSHDSKHSSSIDAFVTMLNNMPSITPSIYNLQVLYTPLQTFLASAATFEQTFTSIQLATKYQSPPSFIPLPAIARRAVLSFFSAIENDVKRYMQHSFGPRVGTLLQPFSLSNASQLSHSHHNLPALPQTQVLSRVISSCLSMVAAVPTLADSFGDLINQHVISPFSERAVYALSLAKSWTDAGELVDEMLKVLSASLVTAAAATTTAAVNSNATEKRQKRSSENRSPTRRKRSRNGVSSKASLLKCLRNEPQVTVNCMKKLMDVRFKDNNASEKLRLLSDNEWNAVVRLVSNAQVIIEQLENCVNNSGNIVMNGVNMDANGSSQRESRATVRTSMVSRGTAGRSHSAVLKTIEKTLWGCGLLRKKVIDQGLLILHAEVTLHCFWKVVRALLVNRRLQAGKIGCELIEKGSVSEEDEDSLAGVSEIHHGSMEFDEFGDPISTTGAEMGTGEGAAEEDSAEENSIWRRESQNRSGENGEFLTESEKRIVELGHAFGEKLKQKETLITENIVGEEGELILKQADASVAYGIEMSGRLCGRADRDVALGAKVFLDAAGSVASATLGWAVVETDYSVVEGASQSASECRTLLYAAGML